MDPSFKRNKICMMVIWCVVHRSCYLWHVLCMLCCVICYTDHVICDMCCKSDTNLFIVTWHQGTLTDMITDHLTAAVNIFRTFGHLCTRDTEWQQCQVFFPYSKVHCWTKKSISNTICLTQLVSTYPLWSFVKNFILKYRVYSLKNISIANQWLNKRLSRVELRVDAANLL